MTDTPVTVPLDFRGLRAVTISLPGGHELKVRLAAALSVELQLDGRWVHVENLEPAAEPEAEPSYKTNESEPEPPGPPPPPPSSPPTPEPRRRGRPRLYPEQPKAQTFDQIIGADSPDN